MSAIPFRKAQRYRRFPLPVATGFIVEIFYAKLAELDPAMKEFKRNRAK